MEVVKSKNKQKVVQINNEVTNDEIINKNVSNEQQQQQKKKGKNSSGTSSNKKKKNNKQKNSHINDKIADDEISKQQQQQQQIKLQDKELITITTIAIEKICNDKNDNNGNNLLSDSQENIKDEIICVENNVTLCCPLTPRRIVDVQAVDESEPQQFFDIKKSNTINSINNKSDNDYNDDEEYDDGDNGLLVQFLDEANKIVS